MAESSITRQKVRHGLLLISCFLFPATFYYLSPVIILQASAGGIINGSLLVFLLLFFVSLFLGRGFCGWLCPGAGCQEALFAARDQRVTRGNYLKWLFWVPWIGAIAWLAMRAGGYHQIKPLYLTRYGLSVADVSSLIVYLAVLFGLIVLPALLIGKRSFCHHLCWMAPFMIFGRCIGNVFRWPALHLTAASDTCVHCGICTNNCPMSLPVETMVSGDHLENTECILCLTCVDNCPHRVLTSRWRRG